jgi:transcriptional regulator with XRE-family HTH domain
MNRGKRLLPIALYPVILESVANTLNARLQRLLDELGITQQEFAEKTGFTQSYISRILKGTKIPGPRFLSLVSREFCLSSAWLRSGEGEMFAPPAPGLSSRDAATVAKYGLLTAEEQAVIDAMIDALLKNKKQ